ncbi:MAG: hypothetical protein WCU80_10730, partial [Paludibacteraceae bacterium]
MKLSDDGRGYRVLNLVNDKMKQFKVHHLVLLAFTGEDYSLEKPLIRHLNNDPSDNRLENIVYGDGYENALDAINNNNFTRGTKNGMNKLTEENIIYICAMYKTKYFIHNEIAELFNVSRRHVGDIVNHVYWKWFFTNDIEIKIDNLYQILKIKSEEQIRKEV